MKMRAFLIPLAFQSIATIFVAASVVSQDLSCNTQLERSSKTCPTLTKTITPPPKTTTVITTITRTLVIAAPWTTIAVTKGQSQTITKTQTATSITTSTTVIAVPPGSIPTLTVPTPAGFTPVASEAGYVPKNKRGIFGRFAPGRKAAAKIWKRSSLPTTDPTTVKCLEVIESTLIRSNCDTTSTTTLRARAATFTSTVTAKIISTSRKSDLTTSITIFPTVATATAVVIVTSTTTTTATVTKTTVVSITKIMSPSSLPLPDAVTSVSPTATSYAACASNNFLSAANGGNQIAQINFNIVDVQNTDVQTRNTTSVECCVSCQKTANCIFSVFYSGTCNLAVGPSCRPGSPQDTSFNTEAGFGEDDGFLVSNGPCGVIANGGNISD